MKNNMRWMLLVGVAILVSLSALHFKSITSAQESGKRTKASAAGQQDGEQPAVPTKRMRSLTRKAGEVKETDPDLPAFQKGKVNFEAYFLKRQEHINLLLGVAEDGTYNPMLRVKAVDQMELQESKLRQDAKKGLLAQPMISSTSWTPIGPQPIPNGQTSIVVHPVSGRTTAIAVHPTNPDIVFISAANGGVFRSFNGGQTWQPIFDNAESLAIGALAFAPSDPTILYVGTGESNQCGSGCYAGVGVYRIDNALTTPSLVGPINPTYNFTTTGATPTAASTGTFTGRAISDILVHPTDPATIFVSTTSAIVGNPNQAPQGGTIPPTAIRGLYRSTNATGNAPAVNFQKLTVAQENCFDTPCTGNHNITGIRFDPGDPNVLVAFVRPVVTATVGGVWRTGNALAANPTFTQQLSLGNIPRGEFGAARVGGVTTFYLASGESAAGTSCTTNSGAVRKSVDGGLTWVKQMGGGGFCGGQCFYDISIAPDPSDPNIVHLGGSAQGACSRVQARSTDGGASFVRNDTGLHADTHATVVSPSNPNIVYTGNDGGIWRSTNKGVSWTSLNNPGYSATQFQGLDVHATDRFFSLGGTQDNGTQFLLPTGDADPNKPINQWRRADFGDGGYALIDKSTNDTTNVTMYHTYFNQTSSLIGFARVSRTDCAFEGEWAFKGFGVSTGFVNACGDTEGPNGITGTDAVLFYAPMDLGPSLVPGQPNTLYFGTDRLYRSVNRGDTMVLASQAPVDPASVGATTGRPISSIWVSKTDDNARIVGTTAGRVFATRSGLPVLTDVTPTGAPVRAVGRVFIDPTNSATAYIAYGGQGIPANQHIWKTTNLSDTAGATIWTAIGNGIPDVPVNAFEVDPADPTHLYAGTDIGVYTSQDAGATWVPYGTGLPRIAVFQMVIQNANRILRIGTHSRGLWEIALTPPSALTISGNVTGLAAGETATVTLTGSTTQQQVATGPTGAYTFTGLQAGGNYTVRPSRANTRFAPAYRTYTDVPSSQNGQDFAASANTANSTATPGQVLISEFRLRGPDGAADEFIELYNNTGADITVNTADGTEGWAISSTSGGTAENVAVIPNGTVIPARKHFLLAAGGYSLVRYASADFYYRPVSGTDIDDDAGLALYSTTNRGTFTPANRLDAVGFTGSPTGNIEGAGLAPIGTANGEISFVRKLASGIPQDTDANNLDFVFVSTSTGTLGGIQPMLGAPGPQNTVSPRQDAMRNITVMMYDPTVASNASPNRSRDGSNIGVNRSFGTMTIRRRFTNNSGQTVTRIRFRVVDITTYPAPGGLADLRILDSSDQRVPTAASATASVRGTIIEQLPMQQPNGGAYNSSLTLVNAQFPDGLASTVAGICPPTSTCSVDVQFMLGVEKEGAFRFVVSLEGLP
ncbi:MAG TPA: lamin tail domain-containing protein [Pyrinomonadaceae bacterium]|nr:lamin tail domain-containing protein [Pyrinomonadaceae bacterium]